MPRITAALTLLLLSAVGLAKEPQLTLLPKTLQKPIGESVYVSCTADVNDPSLVVDMKWEGPNGLEIPNIDHSISLLEKDAPGKLDLIIKKLREEDSGNYTCSAIYAGNRNLKAIIHIHSYMDITFGHTPIHQTPLRGSDAEIQCDVRSIPAPQVDWLKDGVAIKSAGRYIIKQDLLLIKQIEEQDEGVYRCRARVPQLGTIKFLDIKVEVIVPPEITGPPVDTEGVEKEAVTFQCVAKGKPAPTYSWVDRDSRALKDKEGYFVDEITGELTIMDLRPDHGGVYRCTASNTAGEDFADANLKVLTKPKIEEFLNLTVNVETEAEMRCLATGDPLPEIVFQKETNPEAFLNGINADSRIEVEQLVDDQGWRVGILRISDLMRTDDGLYTCTAKSGGGVTQTWGHITAQFPPTFEDQTTTDFWSWEQEPVNVTCIATSIPNATFQWYLRNEEISKYDTNMEVLSKGPVGVLRVKPIDVSYFGVYTCEATNLLGTDTLDVELKQVHKPGPVGFSKADKITATTVTWSISDPPDDGGRPIQGFSVQYREQDTSWDHARTHFWSKDSSYTLEGLTPLITYVFRFAAKNEVGYGEWGASKTETMPKRSAPEEPLIYGVKVPINNIPYSNYYDLQWQIPLDNGESIDHFQILYYPVKNASGGNWKSTGHQVTQQVKYPGPSSYKIEGLHSNTNYKIELRAHNKIGYSTPSEAVIKTAMGSGITEASTEDSLGVGIIVAAALIALLVFLIILDVSCFFAKNSGITASIVSRGKEREKDKEAMLEDGVHTSDEKPEGNGKVKNERNEMTVSESKVTDDTSEKTPMVPCEMSDRTPTREDKSDAVMKASESKESISKHSNV